jgi:hypothetical protein
MPLFIFGDSHGRFNFEGLDIEHYNLSQNSITMHRVGRDNQILNFGPFMCSNVSDFVFAYGEVDCRCHVHKQVKLGRSYEEVCNTLVNNYIQTIKNNIKVSRRIIICSITPPVCEHETEAIHGPNTGEYPYLGTDQERAMYTQYTNSLLEKTCAENGFIFLNVAPHYMRPDGTLKFELSDTYCHIKENKYIHEELKKLLC